MFLTYFSFSFHIVMCSFLSKGLSYFCLFPPLFLFCISFYLSAFFTNILYFYFFPNDLSCLQFLFSIFLYAVLCIVFQHCIVSQFQQIHFLFIFNFNNSLSLFTALYYLWFLKNSSFSNFLFIFLGLFQFNVSSQTCTVFYSYIDSFSCLFNFLCVTSSVFDNDFAVLAWCWRWTANIFHFLLTMSHLSFLSSDRPIFSQR